MAIEKHTTTNLDLVGQAFKNLNAFKRHRALAETARFENDQQKAIYHELKQYKHFDGLELNLRAIQKGVRKMEDLGDE